MANPDPPLPAQALSPSAAVRARWLLASFLLTFLIARIAVLLIMTRRMPDLYLYVGGTHVHHLNYGIILLSGAGTLALLTELRGRWLWLATIAFGVGLGLTFDEFGMWVHLGGSYWQRASFDAVVVVGAGLSLIAVAPALRRFRAPHWTITLLLVAGMIVFGLLLRASFNYAAHRIGPTLERVEHQGPP